MLALRRLVIPITGAAAALSVIILLAAYTGADIESGHVERQHTDPGDSPAGTEPHIIMPTKYSRPGCEEENLCYIPETINVKPGQAITWRNADAAFHSVTSGTYEEPDGLFDSGHIDPDATFTFTFEHAGAYAYHCTLHPWMVGTVIVG